MQSSELELIADVKRRKLGRVAGYVELHGKIDISYEEFTLLYQNIGSSEQEFYEADELQKLLGVDRKWVVNHKELRPLCVRGSIFVGSKALRRFVLDFPGEIVPYQSRLDFLWFLSIINPIVGV